MIHLMVMIGLYFPSTDIFGLWDSYFSDCTGADGRSFPEILIAFSFSYLALFIATRIFFSKKIQRASGKYSSLFALVTVGIYLFYLSGQTVRKDVCHPALIDEYFSVLKIRNVLTTYDSCWADDVYINLEHGIFNERYTTSCDSISGYVISGVGPVFRLK